MVRNFRIDGLHFLDNIRRSNLDDREKIKNVFHVFTPYNVYRSITFKLLLKYEWIILADFSLSFCFRKFGGGGVWLWWW